MALYTSKPVPKPYANIKRTFLKRHAITIANSKTFASAIGIKWPPAKQTARKLREAAVKRQKKPDTLTSGGEIKNKLVYVMGASERKTASESVQSEYGARYEPAGATEYARDRQKAQDAYITRLESGLNLLESRLSKIENTAKTSYSYATMYEEIERRLRSERRRRGL